MSLLWHWYDDACHMLHDISNQDALEAWHTAVNNPDLLKVGEGPGKCVAVHGSPTIEGVRSKAFQRELGHESDLGNAGLMASALARLDFVAQGVDIGRGLGGMMGEAFRPGSALGSSVMGCHGGGHGVPTVTPGQLSAMPLRASAPSPATPTPTLTSGHSPAPPPMAMSPGAARIGVLCWIFRSFCLGVPIWLDMYVCVDAFIWLWHALA